MNKERGREAVPVNDAMYKIASERLIERIRFLMQEGALIKT